MDYFGLPDIKFPTSVHIVNSNQPFSPNILEEFNVNGLNSQQSLSFVSSPASGVFNLFANPANAQGENQSNWVSGANSFYRELINSDPVNSITPDMVSELENFEQGPHYEESHAGPEYTTNERAYPWIAHGSPVTGNVSPVTGTFFPVAGNVSPVTGNVRRASNEQAMSRFREWLLTARQTEPNSPDDLAFETWPVERLAAALDRYFAETRTRDGAREAPASGIRTALALHLLKAHASVQRCPVDLSPALSFNATNISKPSSAFSFT